MTQDKDGIGITVAVGTGVIVALVGALGLWAGITPLSSAVLAAGTLVVDQNMKAVQHPTGGVIGELKVQDGDHVLAGAILARLDETVTRSNLAIILRQLDEIAARRARLEAEQSGADQLLPALSLVNRRSEPEIAALLDGESTMFSRRRAARDGQIEQLRERIVQLKEEIQGLLSQQTAKADEKSLIEQEMSGVETLYKRSLVPLTRLVSLQREAARIMGEQGQLVASRAQAKAKITETELQIIQIDRDTRADAIKDLRDMEAKYAELSERAITARDQLQRVDIRAPQDGIVHQLAVHTIGGVITAGETLMMIVPDRDSLVVEARIAPQDIDHVSVGQSAFVRLTAFNQRTTPEFGGHVVRVSANTAKDGDTPGLAVPPAYIARIALDTKDPQPAEVFRLRAGMPAEVHLATGDRTALSYALKPFEDQVARAFREP